MWLTESRDQFQERLLRFLWRQWGQLGVASAAAEEEDGWALDPEALWLFSAELARHDARLFDEILDWLVTNSAFLNFPRLKSLAKRHAVGRTGALWAMAEVVSQHNSRLRWRVERAGEGREPAPLFLSAGVSGLDFGARDDTFLAHGFTRGPVELRGLSRVFNPLQAECSLLRLRSLFGISARAEIVLYLLTHNSGHPSRIAKETGFSQKNVQDTMVDMSASGVLQALLLDGRKKAYRINDEDRAAFLPTGKQPPRWMNWPLLFQALGVLLANTANLEGKKMNERVLASELRRIASSLRPLLEAAGYADILADHRPYTGETYIPVFRENMNKLLDYVKA